MNVLKKNIAFLLAVIFLLTGCSGLPAVSADISASQAEEETASAPAAQKAETAAQEASEVTAAPAAAEESEEAPQAEAATDPYISVGISEVMVSNKASLKGSAGDYPDWIELNNYGTSTVDLSGYGIAVGDAYSPLSGTLRPGEYKIVYCGTADGYAQVSLSKKGCTVSLAGEHGTVIESMTIPESDSDISWYRQDDGTVVSTSFPSPGYENTTEGYAAYENTLKVSSPLIISEAMTYNQWYLNCGGSYYDWVEITNVSSRDVLLSDYSFADSVSDLPDHVLPAVTLTPGSTYIIYCAGSDYTGTAERANGVVLDFALGSDGDRVYLGTASGEVVDAMTLHDIPYGGSMGRMDGQNGSFYFETPTPGAANTDGRRVYADTPVLLGTAGIYNDVESVTVTLQAEGTIYYTLNGGTPTLSSTVYTGPFELTSTSVVRAISVEEGKLTSKELDLSYIINENHTLPVVSLMMDVSDFRSMYNYPNAENVARGVITYYEDGGSFSISCDMKLHGETSKRAQSKRSIKVSFRARYDGELNYDLFGNGVTEFSSILLRAAQESTYSTQIRDNLLHQIAIDTFPELPAQDSQYCILYINGQYWGLYNIREAHSEEYFASHYDVDADDITQWKEKWPADSPVQELYNFILNNDMSDSDNYAYVCEHLNVESVIAWAIIEAYSGNIDLNPPNMRFYYDWENDYLTFALVDLDLGFFSYDMFDLVFNNDYPYNRMVNRLLANPDFVQQLTEELARALTTTLSDEAVLARIDEYVALLSPEIERDRDRWGGSYANWLEGNDMIPTIINFVNNSTGRASLLVTSWKNKARLSNDTVEQYFSEVIG